MLGSVGTTGTPFSVPAMFDVVIKLSRIGTLRADGISAKTGFKCLVME
jgi:hypothetical protein